MIIYLNDNFDPVEKDEATIAKVIPDNGEVPYFIDIQDVGSRPKAENR